MQRPWTQGKTLHGANSKFVENEAVVCRATADFSVEYQRCINTATEIQQATPTNAWVRIFNYLTFAGDNNENKRAEHFQYHQLFFLYCKQWHEILAVEKKGFVLPDLEEVPGTFCWMELPSPGSLEKWGFSGFILTKLSMKWNFGCTLVNFSALRATFDDLNCVTGT